MLGKLIKHDLKALYRLLLPLHFLVIVAGLLLRFLLRTAPGLPNVILGLGVSAILIFFVIVPFVTTFLVIHRFYKNLFTDEGYLTLTLPVTPGQHLLSKTVSGSIWMVIDFAALILAVIVAFSIPEITHNADTLIAEINQALEMPYTTFLYSTLILGLVAIPLNLLFYYMCIALGQLFAKHRVMAAIIIYFALSTLTGILTTILLLAVQLLPSSDGLTLSLIGTSTQYSGADAGQILLTSYAVSLVFAVIQGIAAYAVTFWIMKKKINLE